VIALAILLATTLAVLAVVELAESAIALAQAGAELEDHRQALDVALAELAEQTSRGSALEAAHREQIERLYDDLEQCGDLEVAGSAALAGLRGMLSGEANPNHSEPDPG